MALTPKVAEAEPRASVGGKTGGETCASPLKGFALTLTALSLFPRKGTLALCGSAGALGRVVWHSQ